MRPKSLAEMYCACTGIDKEDYLQTVFRHALYPHARLLVPLVRFLRREHFLSDYDFVNDVGSLLQFRDFDLAVSAYVNHPANRGWLRHGVRLRVSVRRLRRVLLAALPRDVAGPSSTDSKRDTLGPF